MKVMDFEQGTPEWLQARAGKVTASRIEELISKIKSGESAARRDYKAQIVAEVLTGMPHGATFVNAEMAFGTEQEPFARAAYEVAQGVMVDQVGLVIHHAIDRAAASPDGLVGDKGMIEIKCPKVATHISYLLDGVVPSKYQPQMLWQMACCEREWVDFVSFRPDLPEDLQLFIVRLMRDEKRIQQMEREVILFLGEVDAMVEKLKHRRAA